MTVIQLTRYEDETPFEYHKRIINGKLKDKTLSDIDYSELAELAYGKEYSSDVARRMFYGSRITLDLLEEENICDIRKQKDGSDIIDEIEAKKAELRKQQQKFFDQRREYNKLLSTEGRRDHLYDYIADAANKLNDTIGYVFKDKIDSSNFDVDNDAVLVFSDWHYGMVANNIFNEFNTEICKDRVQKVVSDAKDRILLHKCNNLHIVILGDLFHGAIHTSARVASEELVCDQIIQVSEILAQAIMELNQYVNSTFVYMTYGNHARTIQNKSDSIHSDNMEKIIPWWLEWRLKEYDDIYINRDFDNEFIVFDVMGHSFCAAHGDLDTVKTSPKILNTLFQKKYGKNIEYILLGDKHHRESFEELYITAIMCGSLCGTDDYANEKRLYSSPSQLLLVVNRECGVDAEYTLHC